ncbi:MAG TPA: hypothetical protein VHV30_16680 [Polyangiaceae bacterium]|jgi:hypothetical protein|nr:hypothetical protein [Polyangiaceae bacterium]
MRLPVNRVALAVGALLQFVIPATFASCHSDEVVVTPPECSDPCCGGDPFTIDCAENPTLTCMTAGDPCTAQEYGCMNGMAYTKAAATCSADGSMEQDAAESEGAVFQTDDGGGTFGGDDGADSGDSDAAAGTDGASAESGIGSDGGDASADASDGAPDDAAQGQQ